jgi:uncharacterized protein YbjT (DUF2867 family)
MMKVVITGATGMVGKAVLIECIESDRVSEIVLVSRSPIGMTDPKITEVIHDDFSNFDAIQDKLKGLDACFYCMGVSSFRMSETDYTRFTYDYALAFSSVLKQVSPDAVFNYVSGAGSDSTEKGRIMWARVKGRTENMIFNMGFKDAYAFRPGAIYPAKGVKSKVRIYDLAYKLFLPFYPLLKHLMSIVESDQLGQAMINSVLHPQENKFLENNDLVQLAKR